nr:unnamed protein product [Digitaria exilis]
MQVVARARAASRLCFQDSQVVSEQALAPGNKGTDERRTGPVHRARALKVFTLRRIDRDGCGARRAARHRRWSTQQHSS